MTLKPTRLAVVLLGDRLTAAVLQGDRVETFAVDDAEDPSQALTERLRERGLSPRTVRLGLPRAAVFVKPIDFPVVAGDVREMVRLNLDGHLPVNGDDTYFDWIAVPAEGAGPRPAAGGQRVLVAAADKRLVERALRVAEGARLRPVSVTVAAHDLLALARPARGEHVVWVHRTGEMVDVLFLAGPALVLSRSLAGADEALIADEIKKSLMHVRWRGCDGVWVSGDDPLPLSLPGVGAPITEPAYSEAAQARLAGLPDDGRGAAELAVAVASGRKLRALDLLPPALRPRRLTRPQGVTLAVAALTLLLAIAAMLVPGYREQRHLARINAEIARLEPDVRAVEQVVRELERKRKLLDTIEGLEANAIRPLPVLRELTELLPNEAWLTTLTLEAKGVELTGQAAAASALIPLLENSPRLERVEFSSPVTRGRDREQFRIRAAWEAGAARVVSSPAPPAPPAPGAPAEPARGPAARPPAGPPGAAPSTATPPAGAPQRAEPTNGDPGSGRP